jgi:hypothetical protein
MTCFSVGDVLNRAKQTECLVSILYGVVYLYTALDVEYITLQVAMSRCLLLE